MNGFAVIPDDAHQPSAIFASLEHALAWAMAEHGSDAFRIKYVCTLPLELTVGAGETRAS